MLKIAKELEPIIKKQAQERERSGKPHGNLPYGCTRQLVANYFGLSGKTYEKAKKKRLLIKRKDELIFQIKQALKGIDENKGSKDKSPNMA